MSKIERQLGDEGTLSFEELIKDYHSDVPLPPISHKERSLNDLAPDIIKNAEINVHSNILGSVEDRAKVVTVYDARPINAVDFTQVLVPNVNPTMISPVPINFIIPSGITAVIRWFDFFITTPTQSGTIDQFGMESQVAAGPGAVMGGITVTVQVNGIGQPNYSQLPLGTYVKRHPCYILAAENSVITFLFYDPLNIGTGNYIRAIVLTVYGQFLLSSGRSLNFEPGNVPRIKPSPNSY